LETGQYDSFSNITRNSLRHAVAEHGEKLEEDAIEELLRAYDSLSTFPDVQSTLRQLADRPGITAVVFSNGTQAMVTNSVRHSPDLSPHSAVFKQIITVDEVRQFKPAPAVYGHLAEKMGKLPSQMADLWLVSGNPFDVIGGRSCGMHAIWVDRGRRGWMDAAVPDLQPTAVVHDLNDILTVIQ
jgi:2-haloacid dehalogenase